MSLEVRRDGGMEGWLLKFLTSTTRVSEWVSVRHMYARENPFLVPRMYYLERLYNNTDDIYTVGIMYRNYQFLKNFGHFMYDKINVLCCVIIGEFYINDPPKSASLVCFRTCWHPRFWRETRGYY